MSCFEYRYLIFPFFEMKHNKITELEDNFSAAHSLEFLNNGARRARDKMCVACKNNDVISNKQKIYI